MTKRLLRLVATASFGYAVAASALAALAQTPAPSATASAAPSAPNDPCGSLLSIVNRPTVGTGVCTVRTGHFDVENGYTNTTTPGAGVTATYPQSLIRVGTFDPHLDFEFAPPAYDRSSLHGAIANGWSDMTFGAKYELGYSTKASWGVNVVLSAPTGTPAFSAGNPEYTGNLNWGYTIDSVFSLSGTLGFNALSAGNASGVPQSYFAFVPTVELAAALPGPSQVGAEYAYVSRAGPGLGATSIVDFVYARDFGTHVQVDVEYGFSPASRGAQRQHYVGAGLSFMN